MIERNLKNSDQMDEAVSVGVCWITWNGAEIMIKKPATRDAIAHVPVLGADEIFEAIDVVHNAQKASGAYTTKDCSDVLRRWKKP